MDRVIRLFYARQAYLAVFSRDEIMTKGEVAGSPTVFAVLTGDIIKSSKLSADALGRARMLLSKSLSRLKQKHRAQLIGRPEFFRGDAWQILLRDPRAALRVALYIRAVLRAEIDVDTRLSIGIGLVDRITDQPISVTTGEAFTLSGHALDNMTHYFDLTGALPERANAMNIWFVATLHLCSGIVRLWTPRQAEIVSQALLLGNPTHLTIAKSLRPIVTKQTVTESLAGAGWRPLLEAIRAFEATEWSAVLSGSIRQPDSPAPRQTG